MSKEYPDRLEIMLSAWRAYHNRNGEPVTILSKRDFRLAVEAYEFSLLSSLPTEQVDRTANVIDVMLKNWREVGQQEPGPREIAKAAIIAVQEQKHVTRERFEELRVCPFCGESTASRCYLNERSGMKSYEIECNNDDCDVMCSTYAFDSEDEAIAAWTTRATPPTDTELVRELVAKLESAKGYIEASAFNKLQSQYAGARKGGRQYQNFAEEIGVLIAKAERHLAEQPQQSEVGNATV